MEDKIAIPQNVNQFDISALNLYYGNFHALKQIDMKIEKNKITALIGPSGYDSDGRPGYLPGHGCN